MPLIGSVGGSSGGFGTKQKKIGIANPQDASEGIGRNAIVPAGYVRMISSDLGGRYADILLNTDGIRRTGGGPRHDISARAGRTGVPEYLGHDPMEIAVSIVVDGYEDGDYLEVRRILNLLHDFTGRVSDEHRVPIVRLRGGSVEPIYEQRKWIANGPIEEDDHPTPIARQLLSGTAMLRQPVTMSFIEKTPDSQLREGVTQSKRSGRGKGFNNKKVEIKPGWDDFGDVSKAVYGTRNRAVDIAAANAMPLGTNLKQLKKGRKLRLPQ